MTGRDALGYADVAAVLSDVLGRRIASTNPSLPGFVARVRWRGHPLVFALVTAAISTTARLGLAGRLEPDVSRRLGRSPIAMRQFAEDYADCWR